MDEGYFLSLQGFIHQVHLAPAGVAGDPWPFVMSVENAEGELAVQVHREDAEALVEFLQRHLST